MTRRRLLLLLGVVVLAWLAVAIVWLVLVADDLRAGRSAADAARDMLSAEEVAARAPLGHLREAAERFEEAHDRAGGLVLMPLRFAPVVGRQLRSVRALSGAAEEIASTGADAVGQAGEIFDETSASGEARVAQVRSLSRIVDDVAARLEAVDDLGPRAGLLAPLADARNELADELDDARRSLADARAGARAALSLVEGPRRYLVLAANNAEMRGGSGMWLQGGVLTTAAGRLDLEEMVVLHADAQPALGEVLPAGSLADPWGFLHPGDEWRNLMLSPDFAQSAELATRMWEAAGRGTVDGVLAVDAIGLQAIVAATGPIVAGDGSIGADDIPQRILHDQYVGIDDIGTAGNEARREELAVLVRAAVGAIDTGDWSASRMLRTLGDAVAGRHILAWSRDPIEQDGWQAAGMAGGLTSESLMISLLNRGANKLDWFIDVEAELTVEASSDGWEAAVALTVTNRTPDGESRYIAGPNQLRDLPKGTYRTILAVNVPESARNSQFEGVDELLVDGRDGPTRVVGFLFDLAQGDQRTVVLRFDLPAEQRRLVVESSARVPSIRWRHGSSRWEDREKRVTNW